MLDGSGPWGLRGAAAAVVISVAQPALGREVDADPGSYQAALATLAPGDTLRLAAGSYAGLLSVSDLNGREDAWITIAGPGSGEPAIFVADPGPCCNTVEIRNSSYVALEHLTIDGQHVDGAFGISAGGGAGNLVHHIRIEGCTLLDHDGSQQTVAISTKTPTWGWVIRSNRILSAGTGMYLGNSDGTCPFVGGIIEGNLVSDTIGYNLQIKWQLPRPAVAGMPTGPASTLVRHNVFIKADRVSPDGDRPNVLVGGFPDTGPGAEDRYEIYGNFFFHNPREALLQASGRVSIHDNVFVDVAGAAVVLADHDLPLRQGTVYDNTIYAAGTGISVSGTADQGARVAGNLVFATLPISAGPAEERDNLIDTVANAASYVTSPSTALSAMDFYPLPGVCEGVAIDMTEFAADTEYDRDFNGSSRGAFTFRGAYAGSGTNPGWQLAADLQGVPAGPTPDAGTHDAGFDGGGAAGTASKRDAGGCGCRLTRDAPTERAFGAWFGALLASGVFCRRRR
jgi:hypothetical protein